MSPTLQTTFLWLRRLFAAAVLFSVTWGSLTDADGLRAHEMVHLLANLYRATEIPIDKWIHGMMYFGVCGSLWMALPSRIRHLPSPLIAFLGASFWGFLMECAQWVFTQLGWAKRNFDLLDICANLCGAFVATLLILLFLFLLHHLVHLYKTLYRRKFPTQK